MKTFGNSGQLKITTDYKIEDESIAADQEIENKLYEGLKQFLDEKSIKPGLQSYKRTG